MGEREYSRVGRIRGTRTHVMRCDLNDGVNMVEKILIERLLEGLVERQLERPVPSAIT